MCVGGDVKHCTIQSLLRMMAIVNSVNPLTPTVSCGYSLNDGLTWSGTGCFIAVPIGNSGCQRVMLCDVVSILEMVFLEPWCCELMLSSTVDAWMSQS